MPLTRIGSIGINTGIKFSGLTTITTLNSSIDTLSIGGPVSIAGTLTYEDVTNIDSVGLVTARNGIVVGSGITLSKDGDGFFTGVVTATSYNGDGSNLTGIDLSAVTGATGDFSIADKIVHTGDTDTAIRFPAADTITAETGGSERLRIDSGGLLGLNVTPSYSGIFGGTQLGMHLGGSTAPFIRLTSSTSGQGDLVLQAGNSGANVSLANLGEGGDIIHYTKPSGGSSTERLRILSNGRVAIGNATNNAAAAVVFGVTADDGEAADLYVGQFKNLEATSGQSYGLNVQAGSSSVDHGFRVMNRANDSTQLLVRGDGKIGISTQTPNARLHVLSGNEAGILIEDNDNGNNAPYLEIIGKRTDGNTHQSFSGQVFLSRNRTEQKISSGLKLGTILFGGNHTDASKSNILYPASIAGMSSGDFNSASDMPTDLVFFTGSTGRAPTVANVSSGTERMRINKDGIITKPYTPSFSAKGTTDAISAASPLPFDSVAGINHNNGGHYNTSTYKFTCPVDGYYYVTCHVIPTNFDVANNVELYVKDNSGNRHFLDRKVKSTNYSSNNFSVGGSRIIYKTATSELWVEFNGIAGSPTLEGSSHFGITLIA